MVGTYFINSLSKYLHTLDKEEFKTLDHTVQQAYHSWVKAARIRSKYGCEPPLSFVKTTKPITIHAATSKEIHGLTKIKHGGFAVNCIIEPAMGNNLPKGLKLIPGYSPLGPGSCRLSTVIENSTDTDITIPARAIVCQLHLANMIPKLIYHGDDYDNESEELNDTDEGLTCRQFEHHKTVSEELNLESKPEMENNFTKVEIEDYGGDLEEGLKDQDQRNSNLENDINSKVTNSEEEDDGSWILDLIDLSGLENWPEHLQREAKEMLKRNVKTFSKNDLDMGRTNLVKHHYNNGTEACWHFMNKSHA